MKRLLEVLGVDDDGGEATEVGPGDDAAIVRWPGNIVLSTDSQHEGVHFRDDWIDPLSLGRRVIAVNASDIAAMGGRPRGFLVALSLPPDTSLAWAEQLAVGLRAGAERYDAVILGGDVARVPERIGINVTAVGEIDAALPPVRRDGAAPASRCWVTGHPGRAAAGRDLLAAGYRLVDGEVRGAAPGAAALTPPLEAAVRQCIEAFVDPRPPTRLAAAAAGAGLVRAMIDISDGVGLDLWRLCEASGSGAVLDAGALAADDVLHAAAGLAGGDVETWVLRGGEDYQLLCAVTPDDGEVLSRLADEHGVAARAIGEFTEAAGLRVRRDTGVEAFEAAGWDHFS